MVLIYTKLQFLQKFRTFFKINCNFRPYFFIKKCNRVSLRAYNFSSFHRNFTFLTPNRIYRNRACIMSTEIFQFCKISPKFCRFCLNFGKFCQKTAFSRPIKTFYGLDFFPFWIKMASTVTYRYKVAV
jgi:hypothetical protein